MADSEKVEAATAAPGEKRSASRPAKAAEPPPMASAASSGDPAVHQLIADIYTAEQNGDEEAAQEARDALAELGYA